ncbi:MAG: hypothetical protein KAI24_14865 [Planctomycetes bacterium]|nr:hypothetical protein [Planctomycetota bacterium]
MTWHEHERLTDDDVARLVKRVRDRVLRAPHAPGRRRCGDVGVRRYPWAELLRRVFEVEVLVCQHCGGARRLLAAITAPRSIERVLRAMGLPHEPPEVAAARGPAGG